MSKNKALDLFLKQTKYTKSDIKEFNPIHKGFTNISYFVTTNDNKSYQVRLGNAVEIIDRNNELLFLKYGIENQFLYFNNKNGNAIKKWIPGHNPTNQEINSDAFLKAFAATLKKLHSAPISKNMIKHEYELYLNQAKLSKKHLVKYTSLLIKYKDMKFVLSHNDLNADNLLFDGKKVTFIDFEWARINFDYWDCANFIRECKLPDRSIKKLAKYCNLDYNILMDWIYLCTNFAYQWTFGMPLTWKIFKYRIACYKLMNYYYKKLYHK